MINTSDAYKEAIKNNRILHNQLKITFTDSTTTTLEDLDLLQFTIDDDTSNTNSFDVGAAIARQITVKINNTDGSLSQKDFSGAKMEAKVGLEINGKTEWLDKGIFFAEPGKSTGDIITVSGFDIMISFDEDYSKSKLSYPATLGEILRDACSCCNVSLAADIASFDNSTLVVKSRPDDSALTFRQIIQWVAQISCKYAKINSSGQFTLKWYDTDLLEKTTADLQNNKNVVKLDKLKNGSSIETDDVVITGVRVIEESYIKSSEDESTNANSETIYQYGTDGYVLEISGNKLIQDGNGNQISEYIGKKLNGIQFRPLSVVSQSDPSVESGDIAVVTDLKGNTYKTILTGVQYNAGGTQAFSCNAETPARLSATRYSEATKIYKELRKQLLKDKSEWEKSMEDLKKAMESGAGLYPIIKENEDGSKIYYMCDHPTLEESKVVFELNSAGWAVSTDGGKNWNAGLTVDGAMITKILNAIGINADWINTGSILVKSDSGETIFKVDMNTKSVYMSGSVQIGGKTFSDSIANAVTDSKNYADSKLADYSKTVTDSLSGLQDQIDGQIEAYYYEYEPTLQNVPASEWTTTEERKKHEGDLFFWKPNKDTGEGGYAYRFFYDSSLSKWGWVLVQDTDITKALAAAQNAQDTADGKRRTFIVTPYPPYDIGDTWNQENGDILTCVVARASGTSYVSTDWRKLNKYTDDTVAEEAKKTAEQAKEAAALAKNMVLTLSNDSQSITVDADGKYSTFPTTVTQATVMYGSTDISADCEYEVTKSSGITGSWNKNNRIYTVTGLSEDSGWIEIKVTYINLLTTSKRFTVQKIYAGKTGSQGVPGRTYFIETSAGVAKRETNSVITPSSITAYAYYRDGNGSAVSYSGRWKIQTSDDGKTWTDYYTGGSNTNSVTKNLTKNDTFQFMKFVLCAAGGTSTVLDTQTIPILTDISALTQEEIVNILSNNGAWKGLYYSAGNLYISFNAAKGGIVVLGGKNNGNGQLKIYNENDVELLRMTSGGIALNNTDAITILKILQSGVYFYDSTGNKRKLVLGSGGLTFYTDYTDADNFKAIKIGKYGIYATQKKTGVEELWMEGTDHTWDGYILRYLNNAVRLNANAVYTDGCSMGKNLTTNGTLLFYDWENQTTKKAKRLPVASASADGAKIAYLGTEKVPSDEGATGSGFGSYRLAIRGMWGNTTYQTFYCYTTLHYSDIRLKENIADSEVNALEIVNQMQVRQFDWKKGSHQNIGFVADELEKIDPALSIGGGYNKEGEMDIKQVNSPYLLSYAIKAIQELSVIVENQNKRIKELERRLS